MNFINLTPHAITIEGVGTIATSSTIARVGCNRTELKTIPGVRVMLQCMGTVSGLPEVKFNHVYIVSAIVLDAMKKQGDIRVGKDVFAPDTGADAIRENGQIVAVRGLVC